MSPGGRRVSSLFFKAVRAGLAVKRQYLDLCGSSESGSRRTEKQPTERNDITIICQTVHCHLLKKHRGTFT